MDPRAAPLLAAALLAACGPAEVEPPGEGVLVSAASSLTDAFAELAAVFEEATPGARVTLNLAGSATLARQIREGAPADVFASASPLDMEKVARAGRLAGAPRPFARNQLRIAVPVGNPGRVSGLADFAREDLLLGLCDEGVPCGDLARRALTRARVSSSIDTLEPNVRALLTKIEAGELDAGVVYATDVGSVADVEGIDIPEEHNVGASYPIARLRDAPNPEGAAAFVDFVLSERGQAVLLRHGFASP